MKTSGSKAKTPEEIAAIISATAIARGLDIARTLIIGILGRRPPFARVHVGFTDVNLGKAPQERNGYTVTAICTASSPQTVAAVGKAVADWLRACHGKRFEVTPDKAVVKPGTQVLYLAVAYAAPA